MFPARRVETDRRFKYAEKLYGDEIGGSKAVRDEDEIDIEAEINAEVQSMQKPTEKPLFTNVKVDVQCGMHLFHCGFIVR